SNSRRRGELEASKSDGARTNSRLPRRRRTRTLTRRTRLNWLFQFLEVFWNLELACVDWILFDRDDCGHDLSRADRNHCLERQSGKISVIRHTHVARLPRAGDRRL